MRATSNDLLPLHPGRPGPRLYDRAVEPLRVSRSARSIGKACLRWMGRFARFHSGRHPREVRERGVSAFLTHLGVDGDVSSSTQNQALAALLFLDEHVREDDPARGVGSVELPHAYENKSPQAAFQFGWKDVFPASGISRDPRSGIPRRQHLHESSVSKAIRGATGQSDITKRVTAYTFRHSFATHLIESGSDVRTVQEPLGRSDVRTTMIDTHVLTRGSHGVRSPADFDDFRSE